MIAIWTSPGEGARENREPDNSSEQLTAESKTFCSSPQGRDHTKTKDQMRTMTGFEVIEKHIVTIKGTPSQRLAVLLGERNSGQLLVGGASQGPSNINVILHVCKPRLLAVKANYYTNNLCKPRCKVVYLITTLLFHLSQRLKAIVD